MSSVANSGEKAHAARDVEALEGGYRRAEMACHGAADHDDGASAREHEGRIAGAAAPVGVAARQHQEDCDDRPGGKDGDDRRRGAIETGEKDAAIGEEGAGQRRKRLARAG